MPQSWFDVDRSLPPDIPDAARDALRDQFFRANVVPEAMRRNVNIDAARTAFMKETERPGKAQYPKLAVAAAAAQNALAAPLEGVNRIATGERSAWSRDALEMARAEAQRQGEGTALPEIAGKIVGALPYAVPAVAASAGLVGAGMTLPVAEALTGAAAGAAYEGLSAEPGKRAEAALIGGAFGGAAGWAGAKVVQWLNRAPDIVPPPITGNVTNTAEVATTPFRATLSLPDGREFAVTDEMLRRDPDEAVKLVSQVLDGGGSIKSTSGSQEVLDAFQTRLEEAGAAKLATPTPFRNIDNTVDTVTPIVVAEPTPPRPGANRTPLWAAESPADELAARRAAAQAAAEATQQPPPPGASTISTLDPIATRTEAPTTSPTVPPPGGFSIGTASTRPDVPIPTPTAAATAVPEEAVVREVAMAHRAAAEATPTPTAAAAPTGTGAPLKFIIRGADGNPIDLSAITPVQYADAVPLIRQNLDMGGEIMEASGDGVNDILAALGGAKRVEPPAPPVRPIRTASVTPTPADTSTITSILSVTARSPRNARQAGHIAGGVADLAVPDFPELNASVRNLVKVALDNQQSADVRTAALSDLWDVSPRAFDALSDAVGAPYGRTVLSLADIPLTDRLKTMPNGRVTDLATGEIYQDMQTALAAHGAVGEVRHSALGADLEAKIARTREATSSLRQGLAELRRKITDFAVGGTEVRPTGPHTYHGRGTVGRYTGVNLPPDQEALSVAHTGGRPVIMYRAQNPSRNIIDHETRHAYANTLGVGTEIDAIVAATPTGRSITAGLQRAFPNLYAKGAGEEAYTIASEVIRHRGLPEVERKLQWLIDHDGSEAEIYRWTSNVTNDVWKRVRALPDSVIKRQYERKLVDLRRRAGTFDDLQRTVDHAGANVTLGDDGWHLMLADGTHHSFSSRDALVDFAERTLDEPLATRELIPLDMLPDGVVRFAADFNTARPMHLGRAPVQTTLALPRNTQQRAVVGGNVIGGLFRPWNSWIESLARKSNWPELQSAMRAVSDAQRQWEHVIHGQIQPKLKAVFEQTPKAVRDNAVEYLMSRDRATARTALNLTDADVAAMTRLESALADVPTDVTRFKFSEWLTFARQVRGKVFDPDTVPQVYGISPDATKLFHRFQQIGALDPNDTDILRVADAFIAHSARNNTLGEPLRALKRLIGQKNDQGLPVMDQSVRALVERHIDYMQHRPDVTGHMIDAAWSGVLYRLNSVFDTVNKALPASMQLSKFAPEEHKDALGRFMLFSYAGSLGLRPMANVRDSLQGFMTAYPLLGEKYFLKGIGSAMAKNADWLTDARNYGNMLEYNPLQNLYANDGSGLAAGKVTDFAKTLLKPMTWVNNATRLPTWVGHVLKAEDAATALARGGDLPTFIRESGATWLAPTLRDNYAAEFAALVRVNDTKGIADAARRMATDLADVSMWSYRRGETPGLYKFAAGRILGQYGTWPLNYIEYIRTITRQIADGDRAEGLKALARIAAAHTAILGVAQEMGIDAGTWVFTQPMAYSGSPVYSAIVNAPTAVGDWETYRGGEARRALTRPFYPMSIPGGLAMDNIYRAFTDPSLSDTDLAKRVFGFSPMKPSEKDHGWHQIWPDSD